jgi:EAL domain-containing protein (putative c-di-GMP-specific phosphodiesterase class I)
MIKKQLDSLSLAKVQEHLAVLEIQHSRAKWIFDRPASMPVKYRRSQLLNSILEEMSDARMAIAQILLEAHEQKLTEREKFLLAFKL